MLSGCCFTSSWLLSQSKYCFSTGDYIMHIRQTNRSHTFDESTSPEEAHLGADDIGWQALAPALGCTSLATIIVAARWYSRSKIARCVGIDDYVILLSLVRFALEESTQRPS